MICDFIGGKQDGQKREVDARKALFAVDGEIYIALRFRHDAKDIRIFMQTGGVPAEAIEKWKERQ